MCLSVCVGGAEHRLRPEHVDLPCRGDDLWPARSALARGVPVPSPRRDFTPGVRGGRRAGTRHRPCESRRQELGRASPVTSAHDQREDRAGSADSGRLRPFADAAEGARGFADTGVWPGRSALRGGCAGGCGFPRDFVPPAASQSAPEPEPPAGEGRSPLRLFFPPLTSRLHGIPSNHVLCLTSAPDQPKLGPTTPVPQQKRVPAPPARSSPGRPGSLQGAGGGPGRPRAWAGGRDVSVSGQRVVVRRCPGWTARPPFCCGHPKRLHHERSRRSNSAPPDGPQGTRLLRSRHRVLAG